MNGTEMLVRHDPRRTRLLAVAAAVAVAAFAGGVVVGRLPLDVSIGTQARPAPAIVPAPADAAGRSTAATDWSRYDPALGTFEGIRVPTAHVAPDALGRFTADTDWHFYDPAYGSYRLIASDALGRNGPATDWSRYDPAYGSWRR